MCCNAVRKAKVETVFFNAFDTLPFIKIVKNSLKQNVFIYICGFIKLGLKKTKNG
jgi:hypothetical protein